MKKFRFSLQSVKTVRGIKEMHAKEAFSTALNAVSTAEASLLSVQNRIQELETLMVSGRGQVVVPSEQISFLYEYEVQRGSEKEAKVAVVNARVEMEKRRDVWVSARRDLRVIENLETKARQEYRLEYEREQQALLDDRTNALAGRAPLLST